MKSLKMAHVFKKSFKKIKKKEKNIEFSISGN